SGPPAARSPSRALPRPRSRSPAPARRPMLSRHTPSTLSTTTPTAAACHNCFSPLRPRLRGQGDQLLHRVGGLRPLGDPRPRLLAIDGLLRWGRDRVVEDGTLFVWSVAQWTGVGVDRSVTLPL